MADDTRPGPLAVTWTRVNQTRCLACGENAGKNPDGSTRRFCDGFIGPLGTYMCRCGCHYPHRETEEADRG